MDVYAFKDLHLNTYKLFFDFVLPEVAMFTVNYWWSEEVA